MNGYKYPLALETINNEDVDLLKTWLDNYPKLTQGKLTKKFETEWANYIGSSHSVFCNSGSSANFLMFYAATLNKKIKSKSVVVPSVGWVTTISPIIQLGYDPIMIDADVNTFGIDLNKLEDICKKQTISIVMFVHVLGIPHYREIKYLQDRFGFMLLEDACAAHGSSYEDGTMVGTLGDMSSFSFYFGHTASTIEGGMVNTSNKDLLNTLLMLRSHGWGKDLDIESYNKLIDQYEIDDFNKPFTFFLPGLNMRATDLQAFIGLNQMKKMNHNTERRYENHVRYCNNLQNIVYFQKFENNRPVSISFGALAHSKNHRRDIVNKLNKNGIENRMFSAGNLGLHPFWYNRYGKFHGTIADKIHNSGFFVPNYPELTLQDVDFICDIIKSA